MNTGVTQDELRRHNLSALLTHVHVHGPMTRSELTARMGLNRSTIRALTAELASAGLVREQISEGGPRVGRPSHLVVPQATQVGVVAVDVGVESITVARVGVGGTILDRRASRHARMDHDVTAVADVVARITDEVLRHDESFAEACVGLGVAVPGVVGDDGHVRFAPNLGWADVPFGQELAKRIDLPVVIGNDADLGALAEHRRGAGLGAANMVYIAGDVGVGGGIISGGQPLRGGSGYAGEIGHITVNHAGKRCQCGSRGCLETEVGENAILIAAGRLPGGGIEGIREVLVSAAAGDRNCMSAVSWAAIWLARGLANLINLVNPSVVVLGGALADLFASVGDEVWVELRRWALPATLEQVRLTTPALRTDSVLLGAAELAFAPLLSDPIGLMGASARVVSGSSTTAH